MNAVSASRIKIIAKQIRRDILYYSYKGKGAHISSSLSIADVLTVLYGRVLNIRPSTSSSHNRDRFILSKGHAAPALYATLANFGFMTKKLLASYGSDGTLLIAHSEFGLPGVELTTGSLGHGLSVGLGMALAAKLDHYLYRVFVLVSDAELNEGSNWEAIQFAPFHKLDNAVLIVDDNGLQAFGKTRDVLNLQPVGAKLREFGWETISVDGHNHSQLVKALTLIPKTKGKPTAIIAKTIAGKGISFMEDQLAWHYRNLNKELLGQALAENSSY